MGKERLLAFRAGIQQVVLVLEKQFEIYRHQYALRLLSNDGKMDLKTASTAAPQGAQRVRLWPERPGSPRMRSSAAGGDHAITEKETVFQPAANAFGINNHEHSWTRCAFLLLSFYEIANLGVKSELAPFSLTL